MKTLIMILLSLLIVLISYKVSADEYAIPLNKDDLAPFSGVLITTSQANDYIKTKEALMQCLEAKNKCNNDVTDIFIYIFSGFVLGSVTALAITR